MTEIRRCVTCRYFDRFAGLATGGEGPHPRGSCHLNPPVVFVCRTGTDGNTGFGWQETGTVRPDVAADDRSCAGYESAEAARDIPPPRARPDPQLTQHRRTSMNPDTNRFEALALQASKILPSQADLVRPDGRPVPKRWTTFVADELVVIKNYTFRVAYIGETAILFEPVGPVVVPSEP